MRAESYHSHVGLDLAWQPSLFGDGPVAPDRSFATLRRIQLDDSSWVDHAPGWLSGGDELFEYLLQRAVWRRREGWLSSERGIPEPRLTVGFGAEMAARVINPANLPLALRDETGSDHPGSDHPGPSRNGSGPKGSGPAGSRRNGSTRKGSGRKGSARSGAGVAGAAVLPPMLGEVCEALSDKYGVGFDSVWVNLHRDGADGVAWHGDRGARRAANPLVVTISLGASRPILLRPKGATRTARRLHPAQGDLVVMGGACQHEWEHSVPRTSKPVMPRMSVTIRHSG
jgi:hypothetical protein